MIDIQVEDLVEFYGDPEFRYAIGDEGFVDDIANLVFINEDDMNGLPLSAVSRVWRLEKGNYVLIWSK